MSRSTPPWVIIAGGGTAGHVLPAIAVAQALVDDGCPPAAIRFVGSARGLERRLVPAAGFEVTLLPGRGIQRRLTPDNVAAATGLVVAFVRVLFSMIRARPAIVVSMGGFASAPGTVAAVILRVPFVLAESNARAGAANRLVGRFARASAVAFNTTGLPRSVLTGNPVRREVRAVAALDRATARHDSRVALGIDQDRALVVMFGGSLGASRLNNAMFAACDIWSGRAFVIHHVIGERAWDDALVWKKQWESSHPGQTLDYRQIRYEDRMDLVYAAADVLVCRAGATSIADICIVGLPAVLVPLPNAAEDHQTANASSLAADGAAVCVPDSELDGARLALEVDALLADAPRRAQMVDAQRARAFPDAARAIVTLLDTHASRPRRPTTAGSAAGSPTGP